MSDGTRMALTYAVPIEAQAWFASETILWSSVLVALAAMVTVVIRYVSRLILKAYNNGEVTDHYDAERLKHAIACRGYRGTGLICLFASILLPRLFARETAVGLPRSRCWGIVGTPFPWGVSPRGIIDGDRNAGGVAYSRPPFVPQTLTLYTRRHLSKGRLSVGGQVRLHPETRRLPHNSYVSKLVVTCGFCLWLPRRRVRRYC